MLLRLSVNFFQVIDWLDNHGDVFLKKNVSIGRSLQRSRALQKSHEHFESVAKVTVLHTFKTFVCLLHIMGKPDILHQESQMM